MAGWGTTLLVVLVEVLAELDMMRPGGEASRPMCARWPRGVMGWLARAGGMARDGPCGGGDVFGSLKLVKMACGESWALDTGSCKREGGEGGV